MDDRALFLELVRGGTLSHAARRADIARSTVVRRLERLQAQVGIALVRRVGRSVVVTEAGHRYADGLGPLLRSLDHLEQRVRSTPEQVSGTVRLWLPIMGGAAALAPALAGFLAAHPRIVVHATQGRDLDQLRVDQIDVALVFGHRGPPDLRVRTLWHEQAILVAHPDYLARQGTPHTVADLPHHRAIHQQDVRGVPVHWLDAAGRRVPMPPAAAVVNGPGLAYALARAGAGIARVPRRLARDDLADGTVRQVLPELVTAAPVRFLYVPSPSPATRVFVDHLAAAVGDAGHDRGR